MERMQVNAQDVGAWICKGREYAVRAEDLADGNPSVAMAYYLVASTHLAHAASVLRTSEAGARKALCAADKIGADYNCLKNDCERSATMAEQLEATCRAYAARAGVAGDRFCRLQDALVRDAEAGAAVSAGSGTQASAGARKENEMEDAIVSCGCGLRQQLEHNLEAGSENCHKAWFDNIIGQDKAKEALQNGFQRPLMYPALFQRSSRAVLLYGPPGTGKTMLARAVANELTAGTVDADGANPRVRLLMFAPQHSDIKSKWVGEAERKLTQIFQCASRFASAAQDEARKTNLRARVLSIVFLDEVEVLARDRSASGESGAGGSGATLNTLLQEMDGIKSNENVVVIAATNYPWQLDAAFLRRFTQRVHVRLPTNNDAFQLLQMEISNALLALPARLRRAADARKAAAKAAAEGKEGEDACKAQARTDANTCVSDDGGRKACCNNNNSDTAAPGSMQVCGGNPTCHINLKPPCARGEQDAIVSRTAYMEEPFKRFVNLDDDELLNIAGVLAKQQYSSSDINNLMAHVNQALGREAVDNGTFRRYPAEMFVATEVAEILTNPCKAGEERPADSYIYVSTVCVPLEERNEDIFRLPASLNPGEPRAISIDGIHYNHISYTAFSLPGSKDDNVVGNMVYVHEDLTNGQVRVAARINRDTPASTADKETTPGVLAELRQIDTAAKRPPEGPYTWEDVSAAGVQDKTTAGVPLREALWLVVTFQTTPRPLFGRIWRSRKEKSTGDELKNLKDRFAKAKDKASRLDHLLMTVDNTTVEVYSTWGAKKGSARLVYRMVELSLSPLLGGYEKPASKFLQELRNPQQQPMNNALLNQPPWKKPMTETQVDILTDVPANNAIQDLPEGAEERLVHFGYRSDLFRQANEASPSTADAEMIKALEAYEKNPVKVAACMTEGSRPKINKDCFT